MCTVEADIRLEGGRREEKKLTQGERHRLKKTSKCSRATLFCTPRKGENTKLYQVKCSLSFFSAFRTSKWHFCFSSRRLKKKKDLLMATVKTHRCCTHSALYFSPSVAFRRLAKLNINKSTREEFTSISPQVKKKKDLHEVEEKHTVEKKREKEAATYSRKRRET